jgi:hypothetical protein
MHFEKHQKVIHPPKKEDFVKLPKELNASLYSSQEDCLNPTFKVKEICDTIYDFAYKEIL